MFLKERKSGHLLAVMDTRDLFNPYREMLKCRIQYGEEEQDPEDFLKTELLFLSGEELPKCWLDPNYRGEVKSPGFVEKPEDFTTSH